MIESELASIYEEIMWLAVRQNTTPSAARAWYTHVAAVRLSKKIRRFSGRVSRKSIEGGTELRLEHFMRIQTTLTKLIELHINNKRNDAEEFVKTVLECEQVHIVTVEENYDAMKAKGDYDKAHIELIEWKDIEKEKQSLLWKTMLRGKVANASDFKVE